MPHHFSRLGGGAILSGRKEVSLMEWLFQNLGTLTVLAIVSVVVGIAVFSMLRDKKHGKCSCGNTATGKFCSECGAKAPDAEWFCPECGAKNDASAKFCSECGTKRP